MRERFEIAFGDVAMRHVQFFERGSRRGGEGQRESHLAHREGVEVQHRERLEAVEPLWRNVGFVVGIVFEAKSLVAKPQDAKRGGAVFQKIVKIAIEHAAAAKG